MLPVSQAESVGQDRSQALFEFIGGIRVFLTQDLYQAFFSELPQILIPVIIFGHLKVVGYPVNVKKTSVFFTANFTLEIYQFLAVL